MSLNKAIDSGKEYRKPYIGAKSFDHTCRNHGTCKVCEQNRKIKFRRREEATKEQIKDYLNEDKE